jgi:hypothetical protein
VAVNEATILWSGSALFVIGYDTAGGKYDPCHDTWQAFPAANVLADSLVLATGDGAYFTTPTPVGRTPQAFSFFDFASVTLRQLAVAGYPEAADHNGAAVMVAGKLVRWGGYSQATTPYATLTNTGAVYDPVADHWQPMSTAGAPATRLIDRNAIAVGGRLLVWGGVRATYPGYQIMPNDPAAAALTAAPGLVCPDWAPENCSFGDGALYDPAADRWTPVSHSGAPTARRNHLMVWTGTRVLIWGGEHYVAQPVGGPINGELLDGALYDPATDSWTPTAPAPALAAYPALSVIWSGGLMYMRDSTFPQNPTYTYDPANDQWATAQSGPIPMMPGRANGPQSPTVIWTGSSWIAFGGYRDGPTPPNPCTQPGAPMTGCDPPGPTPIFVSEAAVALPAP